jgi:hypothetical protein
LNRRDSNGGKLTNTYDLSGLVSRLQELEPEFKAGPRPGLRSRAAAAAPAS